MIIVPPKARGHRRADGHAWANRKQAFRGQGESLQAPTNHGVLLWFRERGLLRHRVPPSVHPKGRMRNHPRLPHPGRNFCDYAAQGELPTQYHSGPPPRRTGQGDFRGSDFRGSKLPKCSHGPRACAPRLPHPRTIPNELHGVLPYPGGPGN